jgi:hypothetical protein
MSNYSENSDSGLTLFYSYAHEDEALRDELAKHLSLLRRQGVIKEWYDRQIIPGTDWSQDTHGIRNEIVASKQRDKKYVRSTYRWKEGERGTKKGKEQRIINRE